MELADYYKKCESKLFKRSLAFWALLTLIFNLLKSSMDIAFNQWLLALVVNIKTVWISSFLNWLANNLTSEVFAWLFAWVTPTSIILALYHARIEYINKIYWKKKFPQYDISGEWVDTTTYTKHLDSDGWSSEKEQSSSTVQIEQTCKGIKIIPSDGVGFTWQSILADWDSKGNLNILYTVEYNDNLQRNGYPERRYGYECMHIDKTNLSEKQKPRKMIGKFWHCISYDNQPMHMGDVIYERKH